jgi:hypothetical protein
LQKFRPLRAESVQSKNFLNVYRNKFSLTISGTIMDDLFEQLTTKIESLEKKMKEIRTEIKHCTVHADNVITLLTELKLKK